MLENVNIKVSETQQNKRHMTVTTAAAVITTYNKNEKEEKTEKQ